MKPQTTLRVFQLTFPTIGAVMLIGAVFWWLHQRHFVATASHARGTVIDLVRHRSSGSSGSSGSTTWAPVVTFRTPDGQKHTFTSHSSNNPPAYRRGEQVGVLFEDGRPDSGVIDGWFSLWGGITIVGSIGLMFTLVGGGMTLVRRRRKQRKALLKTGRRIEASFQSVQQNTSLTVNGRHPFQILCQWQDPQSSRVHVFASENLWYDPTEFIHDKTFQVYLEQGNATHYYVDISSLPPAA